MSTFNEFFKEYMYIGALDLADQKYYNLISRYQDKVSDRLLKIQKELLAKGQVRFGEIMTEMLNTPNTLLSLIEKDSSWNTGNLYHQPVLLEKGKHF